ncbi:MAG TPA: DUF2330 domain-containing protein [Polyangiaceae bacterium]|nr:DUF2330 domain-containing protein [Polyangiaceae bacterium]
MGVVRSRNIGWCAALTLALGVCLSSADARACGGTFCDSGPSAMPVDQTGENVLFVLDGAYVEAHVQIQYQGDAPRFAWVVPMPKIPEVTVGSQPLFSALLATTVPRYGFTQQFENCGTQNGGLMSGGGAASGGSGGKGSSDGVTIVSKEVVGAFEVTILQGSSAQEVSDWLSVNGYQTTDTAPQLLSDYVDQGFVFVAIKLTGGTGIDEIHPLVFRYPGNEPCVPLKLTSVAAVEDMGVRAFFLGDDRVFPSNYKHVELNPVRLNWLAKGSNYSAVVSRAVDSAVADGHAFLTEYAGPSSVVGGSGTVFSSSWNSSVFVTALPTEVVLDLNQQTLSSCGPGYCQFFHPLLLPLLRQYLPAPANVPELDFYGDLAGHAAEIDQASWDGAAFAADFEARIVQPGEHASLLLAKYPYLTRLFTQISPAEMSEDPTFVARPDRSYEQVLPGVLARRYVPCSGPDDMTLPDGRQVLFDGLLWPGFTGEMPWAERIEEVPADGDTIVLVDNSALIDQELAEWNEVMSRLLPSSGGTSGAALAASGGTTNDSRYQPAGGCGCRSQARTPKAAWLFLGIAAAALAAARRRSRARASRA